MLNRFKQVLSEYEHLSVLLLRIAVGTYLISSGILGGLMSIVESMDLTDANFEVYITIQIIVGILFITGLSTKVGAIVLITIFISTFTVYGLNALDQIMVLGIALSLFFKGGMKYSLDAILPAKINVPAYVENKLIKFNIAVLFLPSIRIAFGANLIWLGFTEKILAPDLFAAVMEKYNLVPYGTNVELAVFGTGFLELVIGMIYLLNIQMRKMSIAMFGILIFTVVTFHESILAHIMMFAISTIFVINGKDSLIIFKINMWIKIIRKIKKILLLRMYAD